MFPEGRIIDFLIVGAVALIVVGPKDLPLLMRKVGQFLARMRGMAAEFRASFDELARQSELDELRREVEAIRSGRPLATAVTGDETGEIGKTFSDIHEALRDSGGQLHPPMAYQSTPEPPLAEPGAPASQVAEPAVEPLGDTAVAMTTTRVAKPRAPRKAPAKRAAPAARAKSVTPP